MEVECEKKLKEGNAWELSMHMHAKNNQGTNDILNSILCYS